MYLEASHSISLALFSEVETPKPAFAMRTPCILKPPILGSDIAAGSILLLALTRLDKVQAAYSPQTFLLKSLSDNTVTMWL